MHRKSKGSKKVSTVTFENGKTVYRPYFFPFLNMNKYISFLAAKSTDPIILALYYGPVLVNEPCKKNKNKINQSKKKTYLP